MRGLLRLAWMPLLATSIFAAPISISTTSGLWEVSQTSQLGGAVINSSALGTVSTAVQLTGSLPGAWTNPSAGWIGQLATDGNEASGLCTTANGGTSCGAAPGTYTYTLSFSTALGGAINGFQYTADNQINSIVITDGTGSIWTGGASSANAHSALISAPSSISFASGTVTITVVVQNDPLAGGFATLRNPSGFLAFGSYDATEAPEPSTYAMLSLGGLALVAARYRRRS